MSTLPNDDELWLLQAKVDSETGLVAEAAHLRMSEELNRKQAQVDAERATMHVTVYEDLSDYELVLPDYVEGIDIEYYAIPINQVPGLAKQYIDWMEASPTLEVCSCDWRQHPDDATEGKPLQESRRVIIDENPECHLHTRTGRVIGFFHWLKKQQRGSQ